MKLLFLCPLLNELQNKPINIGPNLHTTSAIVFWRTLGHTDNSGIGGGIFGEGEGEGEGSTLKFVNNPPSFKFSGYPQSTWRVDTEHKRAGANYVRWWMSSKSCPKRWNSSLELEVPLPWGTHPYTNFWLCNTDFGGNIHHEGSQIQCLMEPLSEGKCFPETLRLDPAPFCCRSCAPRLSVYTVSRHNAVPWVDGDRLLDKAKYN